MTSKTVQGPPRCEGWRRHGGVFTFGPVEWEQCRNNGIVNLTVEQDGKVETLPACLDCWNEAVATGIKILGVVPVVTGAGGNGG